LVNGVVVFKCKNEKTKPTRPYSTKTKKKEKHTKIKNQKKIFF